MRITVLILLMLLAVQVAVTAAAAPLKVFIAPVSAVGVPNRDEAQAAVKTLLTTRLARESIVTVGSAAEADRIVTVSYVVAGQTFSLDAVSSSGDKPLISIFVEGEHPGGLISAVGKLADKIAAEISKNHFSLPLPLTTSGEIVRINEATVGTHANWRSQPLPGAFNIITAGAVNPDGSRDVFIADNHRLLHYRQGKDFLLVSEKELKLFEKIISLDVIDAGKGSVDLYLTVVRNEQPASQIWQVRGDSLQLIAENLPYYFRVLSLPGSARKLYVQKSGGEQFFLNEVFEAERQGAAIVLKNQLKLPRLATIYNFNEFADKNGRYYTVVLSPENKLIVFGGEQRELWRSNDTYGGSELFLEKQILGDGSEQSVSQTFMNQRIQITSGGDLLVGKNESVRFLGKKGDYGSGSVQCLVWSGDHFERKWHTRVSENYMPDFFYDDRSKEILQLELVNRPNIFSKGNTILVIRKVD